MTDFTEKQQQTFEQLRESLRQVLTPAEKIMFLESVADLLYHGALHKLDETTYTPGADAYIRSLQLVGYNVLEMTRHLKNAIN